MGPDCSAQLLRSPARGQWSCWQFWGWVPCLITLDSISSFPYPQVFIFFFPEAKSVALENRTGVASLGKEVGWGESNLKNIRDNYCSWSFSSCLCDPSLSTEAWNTPDLVQLQVGTEFPLMGAKVLAAAFPKNVKTCCSANKTPATEPR